MNTPITTAIALMSFDSSMTTLGSARRDRQVRRTVRAMNRAGRHEHARRRSHASPPPI
ncbi:hypothetical protein [Nocardioides iriomotensis]|uniref:hypothetical protein n=1 Tax=Nocardioides iriomotensis TaxID=715784 RepID=UPI0013ECC97E|nr:hypothetical protein [Nocardioides iriomotensis]